MLLLCVLAVRVYSIYGHKHMIAAINGKKNLSQSRYCNFNFCRKKFIECSKYKQYLKQSVLVSILIPYSKFSGLSEIFIAKHISWYRDSSAGRKTQVITSNQVLRFDSLQSQENFALQTVLTGCGTHPASHLKCTGEYSKSWGVKLTVNTPIIYCHIKTEWSYTSTSPYAFTTWRLISARAFFFSFSVHIQ